MRYFKKGMMLLCSITLCSSSLAQSHYYTIPPQKFKLVKSNDDDLLWTHNPKNDIEIVDNEEITISHQITLKEYKLLLLSVKDKVVH